MKSFPDITFDKTSTPIIVITEDSDNDEYDGNSTETDEDVIHAGKNKSFNKIVISYVSSFNYQRIS